VKYTTHRGVTRELGRPEEILPICSVGFGLWWFLEGDCLLFRLWRGPVVFSLATLACQCNRGRRRCSWFCPVGDWCGLDWRGPRDCTGFDFWGMVVGGGHWVTYGTGTAVNLRWLGSWVLDWAGCRVRCRGRCHWRDYLRHAVARRVQAWL